MTKKDLRELASNVEESLDNLDFELYYDISYYHSHGVSIVEVDIDIDNCEDYDEDWDCQVENVIKEFVPYDGWYSWNGWCISLSIPD